MAYAHDATPPARRRVALRTVPPTPHYLAAEPVARLAAPAEEQSFLETLRKLWRHRLLIAACTLVLGGAAIVAAWLMPSYYVSEARVLVGVQSPRLPNVESIVADVSPDAERVQNEGFILQSRNIAKQVIDQLKLRQDPEFNPELAPRSLWSRLNLTAISAVVAARNGSTARRRRPRTSRPTRRSATPMIDDRFLLGHIDVSTLGRSHVLSVKAESRDPQTAAAIANALAERYLDYQRHDKIEQMDRVDKFLMGRVTELRDAVRKSDQAVEDYRRTHDLYKSAGSGGGVTSQQLTELNTQLLAAQTAKAEADSRLKEAQEMRKGGLQQRERARSAALAADRRAKAAAVRRRAPAARAAGHLRPAASLDAQCPLRSRQHPGQGRRRDQQDHRWPRPRGAHRRRPLPGPGPELRDTEEADGLGQRQGHRSRGAWSATPPSTATCSRPCCCAPSRAPAPRTS